MPAKPSELIRTTSAGGVTGTNRRQTYPRRVSSPSSIAGAGESAVPVRPAGPAVRWSVAGVALAAVAIAVCVAAGLAAIVPARQVVVGIPAPEFAVKYGLPAVKALFDLAGALTVGWLAAAVLWVPPQRSGILDVGGYRAMRAASLSAWLWCASAAALIPLSFADAVGRNLTQALQADLLIKAVQQWDPSRGYLLVAGAAALIALFSRVVLRPGWACWLLVTALCSLVPQAISGHASANADHDVAVDTMLVHLVGISVWIGGLVAFLGLARQRIDHLDVMARRYSTTALISFVAVALSGVGNTWVRFTYLSDLWTTDYGRLVLLKCVLLLSLGVFGFAHRQRTLPALRSGRRGPLLRVAAVEIGVMAVTLGVAAALGRTASPPPSGVLPSQFDLGLEETLGYTLSGPPTFWRLLTDWRFSFLFGTAMLLAAGLYLYGVLRLRRRGDVWPVGRTIAWLLGCLLVLMATSSGLGRYALSQFSVHMIAHMVLGMGAPILLVLGAPTTLALRALPAAGRSGVPGLREAIVAVMHGRLVRFFTHPLVVLPLFIGSFYAVYFTGIFQAMMTSHLGHLLMNLHFLVIGYLYYWVIAGVDPAPRRLPYPAKLGLLLVALPFHAFFGLALMSSHEALATSYYQSLGLPWVTDLVADQRLGGAIAWGATEVPLLIVLIALVAQWARSDERAGRQADRRKDEVGDPDLDAYNAMLTALAERDGAAGGTRPEPTGQA